MRYIKNIVPFTSELTFETKFAEITSMSLEHVLEVKDSEVSGNFLITGDYKSHAVSVNKEPFEFKLPFSVEITDNIDKESIEFEIIDFSYEVTGENKIQINIEFSVAAKELVREESVFQDVNDFQVEDLTELMNIDSVEETRKEESAKIETVLEKVESERKKEKSELEPKELIKDSNEESSIIETKLDEIELEMKEEAVELELQAKEAELEMKELIGITNITPVEDIKIDEVASMIENETEENASDMKALTDFIIEQIKKERKENAIMSENNMEELEEQVEVAEESEVAMQVEMAEEIREAANKIVDEKTIMTSINPGEDNYATYHIHIVKTGENIETICTLYNSNINIIAEYNDLNGVDVGSKLIIPEYEE